MCATASAATAEAEGGKWFNAAQCRVRAKGSGEQWRGVLAGRKSVAAKGANAA